MPNPLRIGLAQIAPVWLQREATVAKVADWVGRAADNDCGLVAFGECLAPGYPFWLSHTGGAAFEDPVQKDLFAHYLDQAICLEAGHLAPVQKVAAERGVWVVVGCYERPTDRGGHTGYASMVTIDAGGQIVNSHRKLVPTYEERLVWGAGDGHGLRTFPLGDFTLGSLNCWENWMPLPRAALYAAGEDLRIAAWPGSPTNTHDITRFVAKEGRSYVGSVSGLLTRADVPDDLPHAEMLRAALPDVMASGGSCVAAPNGEWLVEPVGPNEQLVVADLDHEQVRRERQNFDPSGHYSRPDVTRLTVMRERQRVARFEDEGAEIDFR